MASRISVRVRGRVPTMACGESSPASALTVRSRFAPSRRSHNRSDTPMMPLGRRRCCPAYVHSGTETRTPPIGDFPTREAFLGLVSGAGFSGSRGSAISAAPVGPTGLRSMVGALRVPWRRIIRPARTPEANPRNQPQKRFWQGLQGEFLGSGRISDFGGTGRASPDSMKRLRVARALAPESPPGANPGNQAQKPAAETFSGRTSWQVRAPTDRHADWHARCTRRFRARSCGAFLRS